MADKIIRLKIDVTKIDKARLFKGQKGTYLDATILWNDELDQYQNNGMVVQDVTKEERQAGKQGAILGNAKLMQVMPKVEPINQPKAPAADEWDGLPF